MQEPAVKALLGRMTDAQSANRATVRAAATAPLTHEHARRASPVYYIIANGLCTLLLLWFLARRISNEIRR